MVIIHTCFDGLSQREDDCEPFPRRLRGTGATFKDENELKGTEKKTIENGNNGMEYRSVAYILPFQWHTLSGIILCYFTIINESS